VEIDVLEPGVAMAAELGRDGSMEAAKSGAVLLRPLLEKAKFWMGNLLLCVTQTREWVSCLGSLHWR